MLTVALYHIYYILIGHTDIRLLIKLRKPCQTITMILSIFTGVVNTLGAVLRNNIYVACGNYGFGCSCSYKKNQSYKVDVDQ